MKQILNTYFRSDIASGILALLVLVVTISMLIGHICIKARAFSCFIDMLFCIMGWNFVAAIYHENKKNSD